MPELRFLPQTDGKIWQRYQAGESLHVLGAIYGCAPDTIKAAIYRTGGKTRPRRLLEASDDEELRRRYQDERLSTTKLAKIYGHTDRTIARAICRAGGTIRSTDERYKKFPRSKRQEIARQYQEGKSASQIALEHDCCAEIVYNAVRECGYKVRSRGKARTTKHVFKDGVEGKVCPVCGKWKTLSGYYRARSSFDGLCHQCADCMKRLILDWRRANPELVAESKYRRRMNEKICVVESGLDIEAIYKNYAYCCAYCQNPDTELTLDHVIPIAQGGTHTADNLVPACRSCNSSKQDDSFLVWLCKGGPLAWGRYGTGSTA